VSRELGEFVATVAQQAAQAAVDRAVASMAAYGVAAGNPVADPDGSGRNVVDVTIGGVTWPAVPIRTGETIASGNKVLILMFGMTHVSGWLVLRA
jgi:hypothetical protein